MNRRDILRGAIAFSVSAPATIGVVAYDPLLLTIRAYQAGCDEFNRLADSCEDDRRWDEFELTTFGPHLARLRQWTGPASSMEGAIAALQISLIDSRGVNGTAVQERMVEAALGYLESLPA